MPLGSARLHAILDTFPGLNITLVGDLFLDRYLEIPPGAPELSLETGLAAYQVNRIRNAPGALGTVLNNLVALGVGKLRPVTVIGDDGHGYDLRQALARLPVDTAGILADTNRLTPTYTKPLLRDEHGRWHELNRLDVRPRAPLSESCSERVCEAVCRTFRESDGVIVLDQVNEEDWGVVNGRVRACLKQLAAECPDKLLFVDSRAHLGRFDFGLLKGNRQELLGAAGVSGADETAQADRIPVRAAELVARRTGQPVFCTLGEEGILVARPGHPAELVPGYPVNGPVDIVGAGDAATSGMLTSLLSGSDVLEAAAMGNLVASVTVQQLGTTGTANPAQILARWHEVQESITRERNR